jgi:DNA-binding SARP family transcriptional activator
MRGAVHGPVYARALEAGIEVETVQRLVREHRAILPPQVDYPENWPWPLRTRTLGRFTLLVDGKAVAFTGKAQRKPVELMQILVALGGREVREERLTEILWPEADGDAAHSAFTTTLGRLRKLVGEIAIRVSGGRISFDPAFCWMDTWALESLIEKDEQAGGSEWPGQTARILALYQGPFLMPDHDEPWAAPLRERLRSRLVRYLTSRAAALGRASRWDEAVGLYQKGLDADGLAEPLHQGLIRAHLAQGRCAEALAAFERCRILLAQTVGVEPNPETLALINSIRRK